MPKYRQIHTKITESYDVAEMPGFFATTLWMLFFVILDSEGRGYDKPSWIRSEAFPMREDVTNEMITEAMNWFSDRGMIERYELDGRKYFRIPPTKWQYYQPSAYKESPSVIPAPLGETQSFAGAAEPEKLTDSEPAQSFAELRGVTQSNAEKRGEAPRKVVPDSDSDSDSDSNANTRESGKIAKTAISPALSGADHPAILAVKQITGLMPQKGAFGLVIDRLGDNPDLEKLRAVFAVWCAAGFKPVNVGGILDWYRDGIPKQHKARMDLMSGGDAYQKYLSGEYARFIEH